MANEIVRTDRAPGAIGPYSQGVRAGGFLFVSGQIGLDPATGRLVAGGVKDEAKRALENIAAIIAAAGGSMNDIVRATVYLADMNDFAAVNEVYATFFSGPPPARSAVGVARLPKDARVEVDAIAALTRSTTAR